jgi:hypothetical protein
MLPTASYGNSALDAAVVYNDITLYHGKYVRTYTCTYRYVHVYVHVYKHYLKNDLKYKHSGATGTLASGRCQHRSHHGILQLRFQLDSDVCSADHSDVCSADLHHNPRKHVGLHAHQRLHRLP